MLWLQKEFIARLSHRFRNFSIRGEVYNFSCPICGDSQKHVFKARGYLYLSKDRSGYLYTCHNCVESRSFLSFLYEQDQELWREYKRREFEDSLGHRKRTPTGGEQRTKLVEIPDWQKLVDRLDRLSEDHPARSYISSRKLPLGSLYWTENFSGFVNRLYNDKFKDRLKSSEGRIIIPFLSPDGKTLFAFQGRTIEPFREPRYISVHEDRRWPKVFGLDRVDWLRRVWLLEGPLDALCLDNALAAGGSAMLSFLADNRDKNLTVVFDNEPRNPQIIEQMIKVAELKVPIVVFPERVKHKDINDLILAGYSKQQIVELLNSNTYRDLPAVLAINHWSKCRQKFLNQ